MKYFLVMERSDDGQIEQALVLEHCADMPKAGVLNWAMGREPVALFSSRLAARLAIKRTIAWAEAFDKTGEYPQRKYLKIIKAETV